MDVQGTILLPQGTKWQAQLVGDLIQSSSNLPDGDASMGVNWDYGKA
jgi:hypothetical protein